MRLDSALRARARLALREAIRFHLFDPNVGLIDLGFPEHAGQLAEDELAIRIHVHKKLAGIALEAATAAGYTRPIPPAIGGFPTDVPEGIYRLHAWPWWGWPPVPSASDPRAHADPLRGGVSISDEYHVAAGTLGGKVIDRSSGAELLLSNWHVLVADWGARPGQRIEQPGRLDGGSLINTVATLTRDAMVLNLDAAVATLEGTRPLINDQLGLGAVVGVGPAELGMQLVKSGRTSGITYGRVTAVEGTARIAYGSLDRMIRQVVTIEPRAAAEQVSAPGDSGSWWLDAATMRAIGLHFAGSDEPERALALDMPSVLDALNVDIAT
jgi:endonuclease G